MAASREKSRQLMFTALMLFCSFWSTAFAQGLPDLLWQRGGHGGIVYSLDYSHQGDVFASASLDNGIGMQDRTIKIFRGSDGVLLRTLPAQGHGGTTRVVFSFDGTVLATARQAP